jgi:hypothetical protein
MARVDSRPASRVHWPSYGRKAQPRPGAILGRSMRRRSSRLRCLRSRRSDDPDDGAKGDHFRSGGAGAGAGAGASSFGRGRGGGRTPPTNAMGTPGTSRQFDGNTSERGADGAGVPAVGGTAVGLGLSVIWAL